MLLIIKYNWVIKFGKLLWIKDYISLMSSSDLLSGFYVIRRFVNENEIYTRTPTVR